MIDYDSYSCNGAEANHAIFVALPSREFEIKKEPRNTFHDYRKQERYAEILKGLEKRVAILRAEFNEHQKAQGAVTNYGHDMEDVSLLYARARKLYESDEYGQAVELFERLALLGHIAACCDLGVCYEMGYGVEEDCVKAVRLYRKAAMSGHASAQYNLGLCYEFGQGTLKNIEKAARWYRAAAEQGIKEACERLKELK